MSDEVKISYGYRLIVFGVKVPEVRSFAVKNTDDGMMEVQVTFKGKVTIDANGNVEVS